MKITHVEVRRVRGGKKTIFYGDPSKAKGDARKIVEHAMDHTFITRDSGVVTDGGRKNTYHDTNHIVSMYAE